MAMLFDFLQSDQSGTVGFMNRVFERLLGPAATGSVSFCRCLSPEVIRDLANDRSFAPAGWEVFAVIETDDQPNRIITSDRAVELREDKGNGVLLLVDVSRAGAGMDGIYNASRELTESMLFRTAHDLARRELGRELFHKVESAVYQLRHIGERRSLSKWQQIEFFATVCADPKQLGRAVKGLGLWPIHAPVEDITAAALELSARVVDRLFYGSGNAKTPSERVASLLLEQPSDEQVLSLNQLVRSSSRKPLSQILDEVADHPSLLLNRIKPGFLKQALQQIKLKEWRGTNSKMNKWAGLTDGFPPALMLSHDRPVKLEVRFDTLPDNLPAGSVDYRVSILSGDDELCYREFRHTVRKGSPYQSVKFTAEDFEELPDDCRYEARVLVTVIGGDTEISDESEEFLIQYGNAPAGESGSNSTSQVRSVIEGAIDIPIADQFDRDLATPDYFTEQSERNTVSFRSPAIKKSLKVLRPDLIRTIELMQREQTGIGRWSVKVREDGQRNGPPEFHPFEASGASDSDLEKASKATELLRQDVREIGGFWGCVYTGSKLAKRVETFLTSWASVFDQGSPDLSLAETVEVQTLAGKTLGLLVLPSHPLRVAWHFGYDQLLRHLRYDLGLSRSRILQATGGLHASHFPAILPGLTPGERFVYADTLAFFATAMVSDQDREPKASVAMLMRSLGLREQDPGVSSMGHQVSESLAMEISRYIEFHEIAKSSAGAVLLHALRPGDGGTVARALGKAFHKVQGDDDQPTPIRFNLEMYPAEADADVTGNFLADVVERHRTGASGIAEEDRWMLESHYNARGITLPRLRWAQKDIVVPETNAHLAIAFDSFDTRVDFVPKSDLGAAPPLHVYGLVANTNRRFRFDPLPQWLSWLSPEAVGEKHPAGRGISERMLRIHCGILARVCRQAGHDDSYWPVLRTTLSSEHKQILETVHALADWVVTIDRNAGIEFFDAPKDAKLIYDAYVIDCVPERDDLGSLQMITSTTRTDEIRELLDSILESMSMSASRRNCEFLIHHLKALSGRLAMRLTSLGRTNTELIALATLHSQCEFARRDTEFWLSLRDGFIIPVDDIPDLAPKQDRSEDSPAETARNVRSDLIYVSLPKRGGLQLTFVEVKYRRNLKAARAPELYRQIEEQVEHHRSAWVDWYFDGKATDPVLSIRRSRLVRAFRFYLEKARRHYLDQDTYDRLSQQLDKWMSEGQSYKFSEPTHPTRGYIFCPEYTASDQVVVSLPEAKTRIILFGATTLPDLGFGVERTVPNEPLFLADNEQQASESGVSSQEVTPESLATVIADGAMPAPETDGRRSTSDVDVPSIKPTVAQVHFGDHASTGEPVDWTVTRAANPHLMIVGFPGMGKTEVVMNVCRQLQEQQITPIVFSYHPDIDQRLSEKLEDVRLLDHRQLGFNPMHIDDPTPHAHVDSAGMLRDIFSGMFPELGDIQLEKIRGAIRQSYTQHGWGTDAEERTIPDFREFYTILQRDPKPEKNVLARLDELDDYQVFTNTGSVRSLLDSDTPSVLQIHATQNEMVQRAVSMLSLYNIYKEMFRRGVQDRITHAVIFDEAHRASKLRLLPRLAAECRKFGISLILASQSANDFDTALFSNVASYLLLRMADQDANVLAKNITTSDQSRRTADRLKQLEKYNALFFREGQRNPTHVQLAAPG